MTSALLLRWEPSCPPANQPAELKTILEHSEQTWRTRINSELISTCEIPMVCVKVKAHSFWGIREGSASGVGAHSESGHTIKNLRSCREGWELVERPVGESVPQKEIVLHHEASTKSSVMCRSHLHTKKCPPEFIPWPSAQKGTLVGAISFLFKLRRLQRCGLME